MIEIRKAMIGMGTINTITVWTEQDRRNEAERALEMIKEKMHQMEKNLSAFDKDSELGKIRREAGRSLVAVSEETWELVLMAEDYASKTGGAFDITIRPLVELWQKGKEQGRPPKESDIQKALRRMGRADILLSEDERMIGLAKEGQAIDLGGIAKGYAADCARKILQDHGITEAVINFGGTIALVGQPKRIGIQHPDGRLKEFFGSIVLQNQMVVTSGIYERFFVSQEISYHHILDPWTGWPSVSGLASATLVGDNGALLDALATSVIVLGLEKGASLLQETKTEGILITTDRQVYFTKGLEALFRWNETLRKKVQ